MKKEEITSNTTKKDVFDKVKGIKVVALDNNTIQASFINQGKDQGPFVQFCTDHVTKLDQKINQTTLLSVLYCYKKAGYQAGSKRSKKVDPKYYEAYTQMLDGVATLWKNSDKNNGVDFSETVYVRTLCLYAHKECRTLFYRFKSKLVGSLALGFFMETSNLMSILDENLSTANLILKGQFDKNAAVYFTAMSLYVFLEGPDPRVNPLTDKELAELCNKLNYYAEDLGYSKFEEGETLSLESANRKIKEAFAKIKSGYNRQLKIPKLN